MPLENHEKGEVEFSRGWLIPIAKKKRKLWTHAEGTSRTILSG